MSIFFEGIFGATIGFEFVTHEVAQTIDPDASWGFMIDLLFVRVLFIKYM